MTDNSNSKVGDDFIVVRGGLVDNDPLLPVFDLDELELTDHSPQSVSHLCDLYERISGHPQARQRLQADLVEIEAVVRAHGAKENIDDLERNKVEVNARRS